MIKTKGLTKKYDHIVALDNLDIEFSEGDFCAVVGANGAGKSTLLRILSNLEHPNSGKCTFEGIDICDDNISIKEKIAHIDENVNFHYKGSIKSFLFEYKQFYKEWDDVLLQYLFKHNFINKNANFSDLSRGQKMQFVLAISLARKPKYILIDEVTAVMDLYIRRLLINHLKEYATKNRATVILATNIITEVNLVANKLLILDQGKIVMFDNNVNIKNNFIKIRTTDQVGLTAIQDKPCVWLQTNSDNSSSYVMLKNDYKEDENKSITEDKRELLFHEVFSYYNAISRSNDAKQTA